jgi:hypothetical protein
MAKKAWAKVVIPVVLGLAAAQMVALADTSPTPSAGAHVSLSASTGQVGSLVTITGTGFPPNSTVGIYVDDPNSSAASPARLFPGGPTVDAQGNFQIGVTIPSASFGTHQICADTGSSKACAPFGVQPNLTLSISFGQAGSSFTATGTGYPANAKVGFYANGPQTTTDPVFPTGVPIDSSGGFSQLVGWPYPQLSNPGSYQLCAATVTTQGIKLEACAQFQVQEVSGPALFFSPSSAKSGETVTATFLHLAGHTHVYISIDDVGSCDVGVTDMSGGVVLEMQVQQGPPALCPLAMPTLGSHKVCGDAMLIACTTFTLLPGGVVASPSPIETSPNEPVSPTRAPTLGATKPAAATNPFTTLPQRVLVISAAFALLVAVATVSSIWVARRH